MRRMMMFCIRTNLHTPIDIEPHCVCRPNIYIDRHDGKYPFTWPATIREYALQLYTEYTQERNVHECLQHNIYVEWRLTILFLRNGFIF